MKRLKYFDTVFEAEVARGKLESEGITAIIQNEYLGNVIPLGSAIQSLRPYIVVNEEDAMQAAKVLEIAVDFPQANETCPECGSRDIAFRFYYKDKVVKSFFRFVMLPILFLGILQSGNIRRDYNCRQCGYWF